MIWFVITEPWGKARGNPRFHAAKYVLEESSGDVCLELNYAQVSYGLFKSLRPWAIVHSGGPTPSNGHGILTEREYIECLREWAVPQLAICKGLQVAGAALGSCEVGPMRRLRAGEPDPDASYHGGFFKELGFQCVRVLKDDPLLGASGTLLTVTQSHAEELKGVPRGFDLLASSDECEVQALRRAEGPLLYGVQFHPERHDASHPDGGSLLKRFFGLARESGKK
jgi:GMP synthase-like glutamine amidotransferase